jgi:tight adherence protein B
MVTTKLMILILAGVCGVGLVGYLLYTLVAGPSRPIDRRAAALRGDEKKTAARESEAALRRKQVAESLKELENKAKDRNKVSLEMKIAQAGLIITKQSFIIGSCISAAVGGLLALLTLGPLFAVGGLIVGGLGIPNWILSYRRKKRIKEFLAEFPSAVEVIIRGVKSGLPLGACLQTVATQAKEPLRSEFQAIVAATTVGLTIGQAVERLAERVPISDTNFFSIVINIQQQSGGNLTEALGNLSKVLRERVTLDLKVKALSSEAKSSAWIIGLLPFIMGGLIYITQPSYISILWTNDTGKMLLLGVAIWMSIGALIMKQMVNFKA